MNSESNFLKKLYSLVNLYLEYINPILTPDIKAVLTSGVHNIAEYFKFTESTNAESADLNILNEYFRHFDRIDLHTLVMTLLDEKYIRMYLYNRSKSDNVNLYVVRNDIIKNLDKANDTLYNYNNKLFDLAKSNEISTIMTFIFSQHNKTSLERALINYAVGIVSPEQKVILRNLINREISDLLKITDINMRDYDSAQLSMQRHLSSASMTINELFEKHGWLYDDSLSLEQNCEAQPVCIVLLQRGSKSPLEFNIRGLVDTDYIMQHNLNMPPTNRLSEQIIKRFTTIRELGVSKTMPDKPKIFNEGKSAAFVFESLNGILWRETENYNPLTLRSRAQSYNRHIEQKILNKCFNPQANLLIGMYMDRKTQPISAEMAKDGIISAMKEYFDTLVPAKPTHKQISALNVNNTELTKIMVNVVGNLYKIPSRKREYIPTFVSKFEATYLRVWQTLEKALISLRVKERTFFEHSDKEIREKIIEELVRALKLALEEMDKNKEWSEIDESFKLFVENNVIEGESEHQRMKVLQLME